MTRKRFRKAAYTAILNVNVEPDTREAIEQIAMNNNRSLADVVRELLDTGIQAKGFA